MAHLIPAIFDEFKQLETMSICNLTNLTNLTNLEDVFMIEYNKLKNSIEIYNISYHYEHNDNQNNIENCKIVLNISFSQIIKIIWLILNNDYLNRTNLNLNPTSKSNTNTNISKLNYSENYMGIYFSYVRFCIELFDYDVAKKINYDMLLMYRLGECPESLIIDKLKTYGSMVILYNY